MKRKLTKSDNKRLCGVCAGIAEYFGWDIRLTRAGWAILTVASGFPGILLYLLFALFMPTREYVALS